MIRIGSKNFPTCGDILDPTVKWSIIPPPAKYYFLRGKTVDSLLRGTSGEIDDRMEKWSVIFPPPNIILRNGEIDDPFSNVR